MAKASPSPDDLINAMAARAVQAHSRIRQHIYETPLIPARQVGRDVDAHVLWKAENYQLTGSFKLRGATAKMSAIPASSSSSSTTTASSTSKRLIAASSGNHGIGCAHAAAALSLPLTVVLPETVLPAKLARIRSYPGVEVILHGADSGLAERHAQSLVARDPELEYISPYNDPDVVAGQGTIGLEILAQSEKQLLLQTVDHVFIAMGGGGLISGMGSVFKAFRPETKIWGVAATNSCALAVSMEAGQVVETEHRPTLAEAVSGGMDDDAITLHLARAVVDEVIECNEDEIAAAMRQLANEENMIVEGAAALALAGFEKVKDRLRGETVVILLCGGNVDSNITKKIIYSSS